MAADEPVHQYVVFDAERLLGKLPDQALSAPDIDQHLWPLLQQTGTGISQRRQPE